MKKHLFFCLFCSIIILSGLLMFLNRQNEIAASFESDKADRIIEQSLKDGFLSIFPEESIVPNSSVCNYSMRQPLLGDDSYFMELKCIYSVEIFKKEQDRIKDILETEYTIDSNRFVYTTNYFGKDLTSLFDEEVLDGQTFYLQLVMFDESKLTVYYFLALERDQNQTATYVRQILLELYNTIQL